MKIVCPLACMAMAHMHGCRIKKILLPMAKCKHLTATFRASHAGAPQFEAAWRQRSVACAVAAMCARASAAAAAPAAASWVEDVAGDDFMGPAFQATLAMLEWPRLCEQIAAFASTTIGKVAVKVGPHEQVLLLMSFCKGLPLVWG